MLLCVAKSLVGVPGKHITVYTLIGGRCQLARKREDAERAEDCGEMRTAPRASQMVHRGSRDRVSFCTEPSSTFEVAFTEPISRRAVNLNGHRLCAVLFWAAEIARTGVGIKCREEHGILVLVADDLCRASAHPEGSGSGGVLMFDIGFESKITATR